MSYAFDIWAFFVKNISEYGIIEVTYGIYGGTTMYFVDRSKIEHILKHIDVLQQTFKNNTFTTPVEQLGLERLTHILIESIIDVGNMMIDGFIMRDPGSYVDIIDILMDERVLPNHDEAAYKALINLRSNLVRDYAAIDHKVLAETLSTYETTLNQFTKHVTRYLDHELDVANAFSNEPDVRGKSK